MKKKIAVGFDFDGVVAYNPARVVRAPWAYFKREVLGIKKLTFFYPTSNWQRYIWRIMHDSSILPSKGIDLLKEMVSQDLIEAHLITGRYSFLDKHLNNWLIKHQVRDYFKTININSRDEQPHLFKEKMVNKFRLDYFIEDNFDIVNYLHSRTKTKVYWIYNILDYNRAHPYKFPYLHKALINIITTKNLKKSR